MSKSAKVELLNHVEKLAYFNDDKNYTQISTEAENLDAVRHLTIHSAKGLEFSATFLPYLGAGKMPSSRKQQTCPNPDGMIAGEVGFHDEKKDVCFHGDVASEQLFASIESYIRENEIQYIKIIVAAYLYDDDDIDCNDERQIDEYGD